METRPTTAQRVMAEHLTRHIGSPFTIAELQDVAGLSGEAVNGMLMSLSHRRPDAVAVAGSIEESTRRMTLYIPQRPIAAEEFKGWGAWLAQFRQQRKVARLEARGEPTVKAETKSHDASCYAGDNGTGGGPKGPGAAAPIPPKARASDRGRTILLRYLQDTVGKPQTVGEIAKATGLGVRRVSRSMLALARWEPKALEIRGTYNPFGKRPLSVYKVLTADLKDEWLIYRPKAWSPGQSMTGTAIEILDRHVVEVRDELRLLRQAMLALADTMDRG